MRDLTQEQKDALSAGFDSGNYANAYVSEDLERAWGARVAEGRGILIAKHPREFRAAFVIGFFGTYENHEVSSEHIEELLEAHATFGASMLAQGIAVDPRDEEEV